MAIRYDNNKNKTRTNVCDVRVVIKKKFEVSKYLYFIFN